MQLGVPLSARNAVIRITGNVLYGAEWDVEPETEWLPYEHFDAGGVEVQVPGFARCLVRFGGWFDAGNFFDAPLLIQNGVNLVNVNLYLNTTAGPGWSFPLFSVIKPAMTTRVKDLIRYQVQGKANGSWFYPTGAAV